MGFSDWLDTTIREWSVAKQNARQRGLVRYKPSQVGAFVSQDAWQQNAILSGGTAELRSEALRNFCISATNANVPVILLHQGDTALQQMLRTTYQPNHRLKELNVRSAGFDPFYQLTVAQISQLIVDSAPSKFKLNYDAVPYIDTLTQFLTLRKRAVTLKLLADCPHNQLPMLIANNTTLTVAQIQQLQTSLTQGQASAQRVKAYLQQLYNECNAGSTSQPKNSGVSSLSALHTFDVLSLNVISDANNLLLRLVVAQLQNLVRSQQPFYLIIDNLLMHEENGLQKLNVATAQNFHAAISADDFYVLCKADEKAFQTYTSACKQLFLFQHSSAKSCECWSQVIGSYMKIDASHNYNNSSGVSYPHLFKTNLHNTRQNGVTYQNRQEAIVRPEEIQQLSNRGGFIYTNDTRELAHVETFCK